MVAESYKTPQDFLESMDAGDLDENFIAEIKKLTTDQLEQVARSLWSGKTNVGKIRHSCRSSD
jgi:hypothetical protein